MNDRSGRTSRLAVAAVLAVVFLAGCQAAGPPDTASDGPEVTVSACDSLPDYDYERMVERVEEIKGTRLERNLSICTEQSSQGIDTTPSRQFARIGASGLSLFGLDPTTDSRKRSSLGYTEFSPSGGPVAVFLANESVVENVSSWVSYEGLVAHELSHAVELRGEVPENATANRQTTMRLTTDEILARQAVSNGVAMHVTELYVERYGGWQNVSALAGDAGNWKRQVVQSVYASGYRYAERTDRRTVPRRNRPNSTAQILHPNETVTVTELPARPDLSMDSLKHVRTDRVGELFLRETFESEGLGTERAAAAADGWANDRMDYYRANGSTVVTWRVVWESTDDRAEFLDAYDTVYDYRRVDAVQSVDCGESGRYLAPSGNAVAVVSCGG